MQNESVRLGNCDIAQGNPARLQLADCNKFQELHQDTIPVGK